MNKLSFLSSCLSAEHIWDTCPADEPLVGALESLSQTQIVPGDSDIAPHSPLCPTAVGRGAWRTPKSPTSSLRKTQKSSSQIFARLGMAALALFILWVFLNLTKTKSKPHFHIIFLWNEDNNTLHPSGTKWADKWGGCHQEDVLQWKAVQRGDDRSD